MRYVGEDDIPLLVDATTFKSAVHIGSDDLADDGHLSLFLQAAQEVVSTATGIPPAPGSYEFDVAFSGGGWRRFWFPARPVTEIEAVEVTDATGAWVAQDATEVRLVDGYGEPQALLPEGWAGATAYADRLRITATAGTDNPPAQMSQAIILLAKEWLEAGIAVEDQFQAAQLSFGVQRLIRQIRYRRPHVKACD
jgi:hypothetical protein